MIFPAFPTNRVSLVAGLVFAGLALGCSSSEPVQQVTGKVVYLGKVLDHGMVSFFTAGSRPIGAAISQEGNYSVELPPGEYQVIVNAPPQLPPGFNEGDPLPPPDPNALPVKYSRQRTSGLTASITIQQGPQQLDFSLE